MAPKGDNIHYRQKGVAGCKGCNLFEKDLEQAFLTAWNGIAENREGFLTAWEKQIKEGDALEKWRAGQMVQLTVVLMILGIIVSILIAYINHTKK